MKVKEYSIGVLYNPRAGEIVYSRALIFYCNDLFRASLDLKISFVSYRLCPDLKSDQVPNKIILSLLKSNRIGIKAGFSKSSTIADF